MTPRSAPRLALVLLLALAPVAAAQDIPPVDELPGEDDLPPVEPPEDPELPSTDEIHLDEHGFIFDGAVTNPSLVQVTAPDGQTAFQYATDESGSAHVDVAGENLVADATLIGIVGSPMDDSFSIFFRDIEGNVHQVNIDRVGLASNVELPEDQQVPAVEIVRPPAWPGAPSAPFLVYVEDDAGTHVAANKLDGSPWLRAADAHALVLQVPLPESDFSRVYVVANDSARNAEIEAGFSRVRETDDAAIYEAAFRPGLLNAQNGDEITLQVYYERRISPLVIERFPEAVVYAYRLDARAPEVTISAPATADDFSFAVTWSGTDADSGIGGYSVDQRVVGSSEWVAWVKKGSAKSATFSGDAGKTYEFRAIAYDAVGNPSAPKYAQTAIAAASGGGSGGADDGVNDAPTGTITTPRTGALVAGSTNVRWSAADPDGTPLTSTLELSRDNGRTWRVLFSGEGTGATWESASDADGPGYRLRLTVSDGTKSATHEVGSLTVRNVVASAPAAPSPSSPSTPAAPSAPSVSPEPIQPAQTDPETAAESPAGGKKGVPAPFVGLALLGAALLARRKRA